MFSPLTQKFQNDRRLHVCATADCVIAIDVHLSEAKHAVKVEANDIARGWWDVVQQITLIGYVADVQERMHGPGSHSYIFDSNTHYFNYLGLLIALISPGLFP